MLLNNVRRDCFNFVLLHLIIKAYEGVFIGLFQYRMMLDFKDITLTDKDIIRSFTAHSQWQNCDLSFANLCSWWFLYHTQYAVMDGFLVLRFYAGSELTYLMPVGVGDVLPVLKALLEDASSMNAPFKMQGISYGMRTQMEEMLPDAFVFKENRDYYDYIYLRESLASLAGKKLQAKRNHLNRFRKEYPQYEYKELTREQVPECLKLADEWRMQNVEGMERALEAEKRSMTYALTHMDELDIQGGILTVDGRLVAFTYGTPINHDTWNVCVEKADTNYEGAYAMINYEYANRIAPNYLYVNREEDLGLPGLRKAKLSYQPYLLLEKYIAESV